MPLNDWFHELDDLLIGHQQLWQSNPFSDPEGFSQGLTASQLQSLNALSMSQVEQLQTNDEQLLHYFGPAFVFATQIQQAINRLPMARSELSPSVGPLTESILVSVPGRKQAQIKFFADALGPMERPILEWCSGKAHLGRSLHRLSQMPVRAIEINSQLVAQGNTLAKSDQIQLHCADVMTELPGEWFASNQQAIALHACGDLHHRFLQVCVSHQIERVSLVPCCYPNTNKLTYQPLSTLAKASLLTLTRDDLKNAIRAPVTQSDAENNRRKQMQRWRLGFDLLQRKLSGKNEYLSIPPFPMSILCNGFRSFCENAAAKKQIALPEAVDFNYFEMEGRARFEQVTRLDLVRSLFRRALEVWLVVDLAMYMEENGYDCQISQFCPMPLTPRNLLIDARRHT